MSSLGVSRAGGLPDRLWAFASGSGRAAPALQRLPGPPAESHVAAEKMSTRWGRDLTFELYANGQKNLINLLLKVIVFIREKLSLLTRC